MGFEDMERWSRVFRVVENRIGIVNQLLGCRYDGARENPMRLEYGRGVYSVRFRGDVLCTFGAWDLSGVELARALVDHWSDCLWQVREMGCLSVGAA